MEELAKVLRENGALIHMYLDDWLIRHDDPQSLAAQTRAILLLTEDLGLLVNMKKSSITPSQRFEFVRCTLRPGYRESVSSSSEAEENHRLDTAAEEQQVSNSVTMANVNGTAKFCIRPSAFRTSTYPTHSAAPGESVVYGCKQPERPDFV
jgi:hypothetical protein